MSDLQTISSDDVLIVEGPFQCARCGEEHTELIFVPFKVPLSRKGVVTHTHWTICPTLGEPSCVIEPRDGVPGIADTHGTGWTLPVERFEEMVAQARETASEENP